MTSNKFDLWQHRCSAKGGLSVSFPIAQSFCPSCGEVFIVKSQDPLATQEGGSHYVALAIQPIEYVHANQLPFIEGNIVKYATRHRSKNGAEDVKKIIHYARLLLKLEYGIEE